MCNVYVWTVAFPRYHAGVMIIQHSFLGILINEIYTILYVKLMMRGRQSIKDSSLIPLRKFKNMLKYRLLQTKKVTFEWSLKQTL